MLNINNILFSNVNISKNDLNILEIFIDNKYINDYPFLIELYNFDYSNKFFLLGKSNFYALHFEPSHSFYNYKILNFKNKIIEEGIINFKNFFNFNFKNIKHNSVIIDFENQIISNIKIFLYSSNTTNYYNYKLISNSIEIKELIPDTEYDIFIETEDCKKYRKFKTLENNVALNKPIAGTFTRLPQSEFIDDSTPVLTRINDGKIEWFSGMANSGEINYENQYVIIDLISNKLLKKCKIIWSLMAYPQKYYFIYSDNSTNWNKIERNSEYFKFDISYDNSQIAIDEFYLNINSKFIGIFIEKNEKVITKKPFVNYVSLMEIFAYE